MTVKLSFEQPRTFTSATVIARAPKVAGSDMEGNSAVFAIVAELKAKLNAAGITFKGEPSFTAQVPVVHGTNDEARIALSFDTPMSVNTLRKALLAAGFDDPSESELPQFSHDCGLECVFLGRFEDGGEPYDLYFHTGDLPTVIARYSSNGPDYTSGLEFASRCPELAEARKRAIKRGLLADNA